MRFLYVLASCVRGSCFITTKRYAPTGPLSPHMCRERNSWTCSQLTRYLQEGCDEEIVKCELASAGCNTEMKRVELKEHMQSVLASHLSLLLKENIALKDVVKDLKHTMNKLQHRMANLLDFPFCPVTLSTLY